MGACELAGLAGFIESAQKGLDTVIGERGIKLSGGQRQRLAIARLILYRPEIAVLDEAASSLDETIKQYVTRNLIRLFNGKTLIIVSHNPDAWTAFDEKLIL